ncbi:hypothetical protein ES705_21492 [subsurface metagenome]
MMKTVLKSEDLRVLRCLSSEKMSRIRLVNESGLPLTQVRRCLERLILKGYAKRKGKGYYIKTPQGYEFEKERELPLELTLDNPKLTKVIDRLPTQAHRIIFWFWLASIVAKKYLLISELFKDYNPGFVVIGLTGEIKSLIASMMCKVLGLSPEAEYIRDVITATRKEILGRKYPIGKGEYRLKASPYFDRIAVCFDEIDKAQDKGVWQAILYYLNGRREFEEEHTLVTNKATVLVSMNPSSKWQIPPEYLRRSFLLDTRPSDLDPRDLVDIGEEIAHSKVPRVNIDNFKVSFTHLDKEDLRLLKELLFEGLKGRNEYRLVNPATLEKIVLGWLLLTQTHDKLDAIHWAVEGNLTLLQTQGATKEGWRRTLRDKWGLHRSGKDPDFEKEWKGEVEKLEAEDQVIIDRGIEKESKKDEKIDQDFDLKEDWEETFELWGKLIMRLDQMYPKFKRANRVTLKAFRDEYSEYTAIPKSKRDRSLLNTIRRLLNRREPRIIKMLTEDVAENKRLIAETEAKVIQQDAEKERGRSIIKERRDEARDLISQLWDLDTSTGHRESKGIRDVLNTIKDNPSSNYARTNFPRRKAGALAMIEEFRDQRERQGAPASEQIQNGVIGFVADLLSGDLFKGKKAETPGPEKGGLPPETVDLKGKNDQELLESFEYRASESEQPTVRRGKTLFEKWLEARKKKRGKPEEPKSIGFLGRSEDDL